jgi:hypothetical protein
MRIGLVGAMLRSNAIAGGSFRVVGCRLGCGSGSWRQVDLLKGRRSRRQPTLDFTYDPIVPTSRHWHSRELLPLSPDSEGWAETWFLQVSFVPVTGIVDASFS